MEYRINEQKLIEKFVEIDNKISEKTLEIKIDAEKFAASRGWNSEKTHNFVTYVIKESNVDEFLTEEENFFYKSVADYIEKIDEEESIYPDVIIEDNAQ